VQYVLYHPNAIEEVRTMQKNVGGVDRKARLVVGPLLLLVGVAGLFGPLQLGTVGVALAFAVGAILTVTGAVQRCPLNALFGVDTCPVDAR
jgi:NhaP-type Na+/H+ or K+/H+ antiporter